MSLSIDGIGRFKAGNVFINAIRGSISDDDTYATGGYQIYPKELGLSQIIGVIGVFASGHQIVFDAANQKILAMTSGGTEVSNAATDLQNVMFDIVVLGR